MKILAHRGRASPRMPGNNLDDFDETVRLGVDIIETDISLTTDNVPIIYHPGSTYPDCTSYNWTELITLRKKLPAFTTLNELIRFLLVNPQISICLDIKIHSLKLVKKIVDRIALESLEDRIYLTAFQKRLPWLGFETGGELLIHAKELNPRIKTHLIVTLPHNLLSLADKYQPDAMSFGIFPDRKISRWLFKFIDDSTDLKKQIRELKKEKIKVWAGILNTIESMKYFADLGIDGIMTDDAILGMKFKKELKNSA